MIGGSATQGFSAGCWLVAALLVSGCVAPAGGGVAPSPSSVGSGSLRVTNAGQPFANYEGAAARKVAEASCAAQAKRLVSSIYDRFEAGAWIFVEGCA